MTSIPTFDCLGYLRPLFLSLETLFDAVALLAHFIFITFGLQVHVGLVRIIVCLLGCRGIQAKTRVSLDRLAMSLVQLVESVFRVLLPLQLLLVDALGVVSAG